MKISDSVQRFFDHPANSQDAGRSIFLFYTLLNSEDARRILPHHYNMKVNTQAPFEIIYHMAAIPFLKEQMENNPWIVTVS